MEEYERTASLGPAEVLVTTFRYRKAYVTREAPTVILKEQINPQLVRNKAGRIGAGGEARRADEVGQLRWREGAGTRVIASIQVGGGPPA